MSDITTDRIIKIREILQVWASKSGQDLCFHHNDILRELAKVVGVTLTQDLNGVTRAQFEQGCREYQYKLFGLSRLVTLDDVRRVLTAIKKRFGYNSVSLILNDDGSGTVHFTKVTRIDESLEFDSFATIADFERQVAIEDQSRCS